MSRSEPVRVLQRRGISVIAQAKFQISSQAAKFVAARLCWWVRLWPILAAGAFAQPTAPLQSEAQAPTVTKLSWKIQTDKRAMVTDSEVNALFEQVRPDLLGQRIANEQLNQTEALLTLKLRTQGYLIGQVVASVQDRLSFEKTGELNFRVFLGNLAQLEIKNASATDDAWVAAVVTKNLCPDGVGDACVLTKTKLERTTQLLQDIVGLYIGALEFNADDMPIGQTKLRVTTVAKDAQIKGSVGLDNQGASSTGQYRLGATLSASNLFGVGDVLALNAFTSSQGALSGGLDASGPLSPNGLRWQSSLSRSQFTLPSIHSTGFGNSASVGLAYPFVRSLDVNWAASLNAVGVMSKSETAQVVTSQKTLTSAQLAIDGNSGDRSIALGQNTWFVHSALTLGHVKDSANTRASNQPLGAYAKWAYQAYGKLILSQERNLYATLNVRGQVANTNLDPYEKLAIGGYAGVRSYRPEQGSLNQGTIATAELRQSINTKWGQFTPIALLDYGNGWINHSTYANWQLNSGYADSGLSNHMVLADAGLGLDWNGFHGLTLSAIWARRWPHSPAAINTSGNKSSQFWFVVQTHF